jgi:hypothetical protein
VTKTLLMCEFLTRRVARTISVETINDGDWQEARRRAAVIDMARFQRIAGNYKGWAPPSTRPFASWPPVGQLAATLGLHALAQCPFTWGFLCDVNLVECDDDLHLRRVLGFL